jgi:hypothetical protein
MNTRRSILPLRELAPEHLANRKKHLLAEVMREPKPRLFMLAFALKRQRVLALSAASLCACFAAAVFAVTLTRGSGTSKPLFVVQAVRSPVWGLETAGINWGGLSAACSNTGQLLLGCSGALAAPGNLQPRPLVEQSSAVSTDTEVVGGSDSQRALLRLIIDATRPNTIDKISIAGSSGTVTLQMQAKDNSMRTLWQESLVASAFRDRVAATNKTAVSLENGDSSGVIPPGPARSLPSATEGDEGFARKTFEDAAAQSGATLDELTTYTPDGVAVAATLRATEPAAFLLHHMPAFLAAIGDRWHDYDGVYVRLVDSSGSTVWETSTAARTSTGSVESREDLTGCSPVAHWGSSSPTCPAK